MRGRVDGKRVVPYWPRADIEAGRAPLDGKALAYVEDPVDAFFLQIQGSGRIALDGGGVMRVGYADQNGRPFKPVARMLIERGELAQDTGGAIRGACAPTSSGASATARGGRPAG